jgi:hypothetical protein
MLDHLDFKISFFPGNAAYLGKGKQFDINVPADLDQFG